MPCSPRCEGQYKVHVESLASHPFNRLMVLRRDQEGVHCWNVPPLEQLSVC